MSGGSLSQPLAPRPQLGGVRAQASAVLREEAQPDEQRVWWAPFNGSLEGYLEKLGLSLAAIHRQVRGMHESSAEMRRLNEALEGAGSVLDAVRTGVRRQRETQVNRDKVPRQVSLVQQGLATSPQEPPAKCAGPESTAPVDAAIAVMQAELEQAWSSNRRLQLAVAEEHEMRVRLEDERNLLRNELVHSRSRSDGSEAPQRNPASGRQGEDALALKDRLADAIQEIRDLTASEKEARKALHFAELNLETSKKLEEQHEATIEELRVKLRDAGYHMQWQNDVTLLLARLRSWGLRSDVAKHIPPAERLFTQTNDAFFSSEHKDWLGTLAILLEQTERLLSQHQCLPELDKSSNGDESLQRWLKSARVKDQHYEQKLYATRRWLSRTLALKHVDGILHTCWRAWLSHVLQEKKTRHAEVVVQVSGTKHDIVKQQLTRDLERLSKELGQAKSDVEREREARQILRDQITELKRAASCTRPDDAAAAKAADDARTWATRLAEKDSEINGMKAEISRVIAEHDGLTVQLKRLHEELKVVNRRAEEGEKLLAVYHKENIKVKGYDPIAASAPAALHAVLNPKLRGGPVPAPRYSMDGRVTANAVQGMRMFPAQHASTPATRHVPRPNSAGTRPMGWSASLSTTMGDFTSASDSSQRILRPQSAAAIQYRRVSDAARVDMPRFRASAGSAHGHPSH